MCVAVAAFVARAVGDDGAVAVAVAFFVAAAFALRCGLLLLLTGPWFCFR